MKQGDYGSKFLAFIAAALFILVPTAFLLIIYVKTVIQGENLNET